MRLGKNGFSASIEFIAGSQFNASKYSALPSAKSILSMMKTMQILILTMTLIVGCKPVNTNNFLSCYVEFTDRYIFRDVAFFESANKDTLIVELKPFFRCGFDSSEPVDCQSLFKQIYNRAKKLKFKTIINDTGSVYTFENRLPKYILDISINDNTPYIIQIYSYKKNGKDRVLNLDTTFKTKNCW